MKNLVFKILFWILWPLIFLYAPVNKRARVLVINGNEFLAVKSYFGNNNWQLPGGGIKFKESAKDAASRELQEELSLTLNKLDNLVLDKNYWECGLFMRYSIFVCVLPERPLVIKNSEIYKTSWINLDSDINLSLHVKTAITAYNKGNLLK